MLLAFKWCVYIVSIALCWAITNSVISGRVVKRSGSAKSWQLPTHQRHSFWILAIIILILVVIEGFALILPQIRGRHVMFWPHVVCLTFFSIAFVLAKFRKTGIQKENRKWHRRLGYSTAAFGYLTALTGSIVAYLK